MPVDSAISRAMDVFETHISQPRAGDTLEEQQPLHVASQLVTRSILRVKGSRRVPFQRNFDLEIEKAHQKNPTVSRALLARFAVQDVAAGRTPDYGNDVRAQAKVILSEEYIRL